MVDSRGNVISTAVNMMFTTYSKIINDMSKAISSVEYEKSLFDPYYISHKVKELNKVLGSIESRDEVLNDILFYESMIKLPKDCQQTYNLINVKGHYASTGFPAICYFYKGEFEWAYRMAKEYYAINTTVKHPVMLTIYSKLLLDRNELTKAKSYAYQAVEIVPSLYEVHKLLRDIYFRTGQTLDAEIEDQIMKLLERGDDDEVYHIQ